ncbi:hypothetical protein [uncultured Polaribacter sp.]|uniref:hypothetical protein n=1 Tax=uncultured Polaribacter sp. TaxID=174711 RepID=UPI0030DCEB23
MKKYILFYLVSIMFFSCKKRNKEEWTVFLKEKIENTSWETGYNNENIIFKNDSLRLMRNDSLIKEISYNIEGKPPTGLMGYGSLFYLRTNNKKFELKFWDNYKILVLRNYEPINFLLTSKKDKEVIDSLILNGMIKENISNRFSIQKIDSILSNK